MKQLILLFSLLSGLGNLCAQSTGVPHNLDTSKLEWSGKQKNGYRTGEWKATSPKGSVIVVTTYEKGKLNGNWDQYFGSGSVSVKGVYTEGLKEGMWVGYYPNGDTQYVETYHEGKLHGPYRDYSRDKRLLISGTYVNGMRNGNWVHYFGSGSVRLKAVYTEEVKTGMWVGYYENGDTQNVETFHEGKLHGPYRNYDRNKRRLNSGTYVNGMRNGRWENVQPGATPDSTVAYFVNDTLHGTKEMYKNGILTDRLTYQKGKLHGEYLHHTVKGELLVRSYYVNALLDGVTIKYDTKGSVTDSGSYSQGKKIGGWVYRRKPNASSGTIGKSYYREWYAPLAYDTTYINPRTGNRQAGPVLNPVERLDSVYKYSENGKLIYKAVYRDSSSRNLRRRSVAVITTYYEGTKAVETSYQTYLNETFGPMNYYYSNGRLKSAVSMSGALVNGPCVWYHNNGKIRARDTVNYARLTDKLVLYDRSGKVIAPTATNYNLMRDSLFSFTPGLYPYSIMTQEGDDDDSGPQIITPTIDQVEPEDGTEVFMFAEEMPSFQGGEGGFQDYLRTNLKQPAGDSTQGTVYIYFEVARDGSIVNVKTVKGIPNHPALAKEAERVIAAMPPWNPGKMNGRAVKVGMTTPVRFVK